MLRRGCRAAAPRSHDGEGVIRALDQRIADAQGKVARIAADEQELILLRERLRESIAVLGSKERLDDFARTAHSYSTQAGVALRAFEPAEVAIGAFTGHRYQMTCTGTLWQLLKFVNSFENHRCGLVSVTALDLSPGEPEGYFSVRPEVEHRLVLTVEAVAYVGSRRSRSRVTRPSARA